MIEEKFRHARNTVGKSFPIQNLRGKFSPSKIRGEIFPHIWGKNTHWLYLSVSVKQDTLEKLNFLKQGCFVYKGWLGFSKNFVIPYCCLEILGSTCLWGRKNAFFVQFLPLFCWEKYVLKRVLFNFKDFFESQDGGYASHD